MRRNATLDRPAGPTPALRARTALAGAVIAGLLLALVVGSAPASAREPSFADTARVGAEQRIVINEIAAASSVTDADSFFELRNVSGEAVDLSGWAAYRCDQRGLRVGLGMPEVNLAGVVLEPGEIYTAAHMSAHGAAPAAQARFSNVYTQVGFGLALTDPSGTTVDSVAVYPNTPWATQSECAAPANLPVSLAAALDESWQRTDDGEWVRAHATPGAQNAQADDERGPRGIRIDEIAAAGAAGRADDLVELLNTTKTAADISGWRLYRCTARGEATGDTVQVEFPAGTVVQPGARVVIGGPTFTAEGIEPDFRTRTSLADSLSGALLVDQERRRVDGVSLSSHADTACQDGDDKLDAGLDYRTGQSWQRDDAGRWGIAARTPGAQTMAVADAATAASGDTQAVAISEFAVDPEIDASALAAVSSVVRNHFVEIANYSTRPQPIGGFQLVACGLDGFRERTALAQVPAGTTLAAGKTWVAALAGTDAALAADAVFDAPLDFRGAGVVLEDPRGTRIDGVGAYHVNEMDRSVDTPSACTTGLTLTVFAVDRLRGETYQRGDRSADNASDFVAARATPGILANRTITDPRVLVDDAALRIASLAERAKAVGEPATAAAASVRASAAEGRPVQIIAAVRGASDAPLEQRSASGEEPLAARDVSGLTASDDEYRFPYVRLTLSAKDLPGEVRWRGSVLSSGETRLSVWRGGAWRPLDTVATDGAGEVTLSGAVVESDIEGATVDLLVQSVPRSESRLSADEAMADPSGYDFALTHLTDTQYLSEAYPEVYADVIGWVVANAEERKIAFASHTGDLIQNWVDPDQPADRARREFEVASAMQAALDDARIPNSVLPGNHDSKRGVSPELFNEYFGPERYRDKPWYGGSIAPGDNTANFSTFTAEGAKMLMLSLPYAYSEREIAWAEEVVAQHPQFNVVVSTHEHVTPKTAETVANRSNSSRWVSHADELWNRVVAPNRNVVMVLSGHFHGLGRIVTENAGGIPGHTVVEALADYQEFRTHTGERATGFSRLIQVDLAGGRIAVDAHSSTMDAATSAPFDYEQFVRDDGHESTPSNDRPWRVLADGLQNRYGPEDDHFTVDVQLQYVKGFATTGVSVDLE